MPRTLAILIWLWAWTAGWAEDALPLPTKSFEQLSERSVSRSGEAALNLKSVQWEHCESDHFIFHTEAGFAVSQLAGLAERSYTAIKKDLGIAQDTFERKCHIYVFLNEDMWREFARTGKMEAWTGGWCTGRELFFHSRAHFKFQGTTLPHEVTHLVLHRFIGGDVPLWLNEGFAEFEGIRIYRGYLLARNYELVGVADHLERERYIPLEKLTAAIDYPATKEAAQAFYIESQRLVNFLYHKHGGLEPFVKFLKLQSQGARFETAFREVYGEKYWDVKVFEEKFIEYLTKGKE